MRVLQWMQNAYNYFRTYMQVLHIWKFPYGIYNRKWCRYYMFEMCVLFFRWCESYYIRCKYCTMFILIFGLIFTSQVLRKLWQRRHMINHIPIKQMWVEDTIILIKDVQKWVHEKLLKNPMKKKCWFSITYKRIEIQYWVVQKIKRLQNLTNYIEWNPNPYQYLQSHV